ncbi:cellulase family glycosylhydrolase [bacterium]|nr:cellulase family glycosylhydrolase [bacterium]
MKKAINRVFIASLVLFLLPVFCLASSSEVPADRYARLEKGVNIPGWLWLNRGPVRELETQYAGAEFALMKKMGITCVRVPIDMENIYDPTADNLLKKPVLEIMDRGFVEILEHNLAIIVDLHSISQSTGGSNYSGDLGKDDQVTNGFINFWEHFADHLSTYDPNDIILSPMNEPVFRGMEKKWPPIQERVITRIRAEAPLHTIIATNVHWSNLDWLVKLKPVDDENIIYNFHFYEPHVFTHQGASWSSDIVKPMRKVPYPSSPEAVEAAIALVDSQKVKNRLKNYGKERWNKEKLEHEMQKVAKWAKANNCKLLCDEFGVYDRYALHKHRVAWIKDVRQTFEKFGVHWAMWTWAGSFGLVDRGDDGIEVDEDVAKALGLDVN